MAQAILRTPTALGIRQLSSEGDWEGVPSQHPSSLSPSSVASIPWTPNPPKGQFYCESGSALISVSTRLRMEFRRLDIEAQVTGKRCLCQQIFVRPWYNIPQTKFTKRPFHRKEPRLYLSSCIPGLPGLLCPVRTGPISHCTEGLKRQSLPREENRQRTRISKDRICFRQPNMIN